jgi:hypothetical protein
MRPSARIQSLRAVTSFLAGFALASVAVSTAAANPGSEGEPAFGISGWFNSPPPRLDLTGEILIRIWGEDAYDPPVTSVARISLPDGIELVSGDTVSVNQVVKRSRKRVERVMRLVIRPVRTGRYIIRGRLGIDAGPERGADETEFLLPLEIGPDTPTEAHAPRVTRFETVRHGQRYRYAGPYLVPIDSTQALLEEEITLKARPKEQEPARCPDCPGPLPAVVPFVVMVGSDGSVRETRYLDIQEEGAIDPLVVTYAAEALARWKFEPARAKDLAVADYLIVRVPVRNQAP